MTGRRFEAGQVYEIPPFEYRLVNGKKTKTRDGHQVDDLRLDWRWVGPVGWRPVELDHVGFIIDAIADNENVIHPYPERGGGMVYTFLKQALRDGWVQARHDLHLFRARRDERRELGES